MQQSSATVVQRDLLLSESSYFYISLNLPNKECQRELCVSKDHSNPLCSSRELSPSYRRTLLGHLLFQEPFVMGAIHPLDSKKIPENDIMTARSEEIRAKFKGLKKKAVSPSETGIRARPCCSTHELHGHCHRHHHVEHGSVTESSPRV